jgi:hypothetical protein
MAGFLSSKTALVICGARRLSPRRGSAISQLELLGRVHSTRCRMNSTDASAAAKLDRTAAEAGAPPGWQVRPRVRAKPASHALKLLFVC